MKIQLKKNSLAILSMLLLPIAIGNAAGLSLITLNQSGLPNVGNSPYQFELSANGRFMAFNSYDNLVANDTNELNDFYVRDIVANKTILASVNRAGNAAGSYGITYPVITPDGRFVVFTGDIKNLVANATTGKWGIFVRDLKTKTTQLVTVNSAGKASSHHGLQAKWVGGYAISTDGRFVAFDSDASDLVANDTNHKVDIFVRDLKAGTTKLVSTGSWGGGYLVSIGSTGRFVRFRGSHPVNNTLPWVVSDSVRDMKTNKTIFLETDAISSADGRYVAFTSGNPQDPARNVFIHDLVTLKKKLVSINRAGKQSDSSINADYLAGSQLKAMSPNGRYVLFDSDANDLLAERTVGKNYSGSNVYVRDLMTNKTTLVSRDNAGKVIGGYGHLLSDNGHTVLFSSNISKDSSYPRWALFNHNLTTHKTSLFGIGRAGEAITVENLDNSLNGPFHTLTLSSDGRFVAFSSYLDLVAHDTNEEQDVFVKDLETDTTKLISTNITGANGGNCQSDNPVLSADDRVVVFNSCANNLVKNDANKSNDLFSYRIR